MTEVPAMNERLSGPAHLFFEPSEEFKTEFIAPILDPDVYQDKDKYGKIRLGTQALTAYQDRGQPSAEHEIKESIPEIWMRGGRWIRAVHASYGLDTSKRPDEYGKLVEGIRGFDIRFALDAEATGLLLRILHPELGDLSQEDARVEAAKLVSHGEAKLHFPISPHQLPFEKKETKARLDAHIEHINTSLGKRALAPRLYIRAMPKIVVPYRPNGGFASH
jgi:hypothetical protein